MNIQPPQFTTVQHRNPLVAWVSVLTESEAEIASVHLPATISDEDLKTAERHISAAVHSAARIGHARGIGGMRAALKEIISG